MSPLSNNLIVSIIFGGTYWSLKLFEKKYTKCSYDITVDIHYFFYIFTYLYSCIIIIIYIMWWPFEILFLRIWKVLFSIKTRGATQYHDNIYFIYIHLLYNTNLWVSFHTQHYAKAISSVPTYMAIYFILYVYIIYYWYYWYSTLYRLCIYHVYGSSM